MCQVLRRIKLRMIYWRVIECSIELKRPWRFVGRSQISRVTFVMKPAVGRVRFLPQVARLLQIEVERLAFLRDRYPHLRNTLDIPQ